MSSPITKLTVADTEISVTVLTRGAYEHIDIKGSHRHQLSQRPYKRG